MKRIVKTSVERKKEIIEEAQRLFREKGQENLTMQELMDRLNIAKGTIYHHFRSKSALLEAIVEDIVDKELKRKDVILQSPDCKDLNALEKIKVLVTNDKLAEENERVLESLHGTEHAGMHARQLGRYLVRLAPLFASVIEQGCREKVFHTKRPLEAAEFMLAGAQFITDVGFYPWSAEQLVRRVSAFPALIEGLLGAPEGSFSFLDRSNE